RLLRLISASPSVAAALSLHDALPIYPGGASEPGQRQRHPALCPTDGEAVRRDGRSGARRGPHAHRPLLLVQDQPAAQDRADPERSEEHTSELQSRFDLVCRLLLEKTK